MLSALKRPTEANAYLMLSLTMLFWAGNYTIGRWAAGHVPPVTLAFLRWTGATLLILPFAWSAIRSEWPLIRRSAGPLLLLGVTGSGLFNTLQYLALTSTTATSAGIINSATPVLIVLLSFALNGERVRPGRLLGILTSLIGVLVVMTKASPAALSALEVNRGDVVMLVAIVFWAIYTALLERRPRISAFAFAAVTYIIASGLNALLSAAEVLGGARVDWTAASVAAIAYTAIFPSFLAYLFFNRGVEIIGPARAGAFMHLVPLFTGALALIFLGEVPQLYHAVGLVLILSGVWLAARRE